MKKTVNIRATFLAAIMLLFVEPVSLLAQVIDSGDTIKIGLLISEKGFKDAQRGAELAVKEANQKNFLPGKNVKLITRSMEGPWGTGAKQTVDLVFNQKVLAIVGSHDGRNAHLAEQVISKTQVVYVSAWAGDPTLAQAYVPWFFSMAPNNIQQAQSLFSQIYSGKEPGKVVALSDSTYDAENALRFFLEKIEAEKIKEPKKVRYNVLDFNVKRILSVINNEKPNVLVLFGKPHESVLLLKELSNLTFQPEIFGTFEILGEDPTHIFSFDDFKGVVVPDVHFLNSAKGIQFIKDYEAEYQKNASPTAVYSYDATWLILKKLKESGFDGDSFKKLMRKADENGVTGIIRFDEIGNRKQAVNWITIQ